VRLTNETDEPLVLHPGESVYLPEFSLDVTSGTAAELVLLEVRR
jgi:hypothetical protein